MLSLICVFVLLVAALCIMQVFSLRKMEVD